MEENWIRKIVSANWTLAHRMRLDTSPNPAKQTKLSNWKNKRNIFLPGCRFLASRIFRHNWAQQVESKSICTSNFITARQWKEYKATASGKSWSTRTMVRRRCYLLHAIRLAAARRVYWADTYSSCQCPKTLDFLTKPNDQKNMKKKGESKHRLNRVNNFLLKFLIQIIIIVRWIVCAHHTFVATAPIYSIRTSKIWLVRVASIFPSISLFIFVVQNHYVTRQIGGDAPKIEKFDSKRPGSPFIDEWGEKNENEKKRMFEIRFWCRSCGIGVTNKIDKSIDDVRCFGSEK